VSKITRENIFSKGVANLSQALHICNVKTTQQMIRTTITPKEFEKITWLQFENVASDINDIKVELQEHDIVKISVLGEELCKMSVSNYNAIVK